MLAAIFLVALTVLILNRRYVLVPLLAAAIFVPLEQRIAIEGINFNIIRILILLGWLRIIIRREYQLMTLSTIDIVFVGWVVIKVFAFNILWQAWTPFVNIMGFAFDALGLYFLFRCTIIDFDEFKTAVRILSFISIILAGFMVLEQQTGVNVFSVFGGVPAITAVREGVLRSQGAFAHPICAGMFGATLMPVFLSLWWQDSRWHASVAVLSALIIVMTSGSSAPILTLAAGTVALIAWRFRSFLPQIRWAIVLALVGLHIVMKAPVWALIGRVGLVGGSSGYHRYALVDNFIRRFNEWWLFGTYDTAHWGYNMDDMVNQYVGEGTQGGFLTLMLFIAIIYLCFRTIGRLAKALENRSTQLMLWSLGSSLFAHVVGFFGIAYWDQQKVIWYILLAVISTFATTLPPEKYPFNEGTK